jgi:hypothetical protein
MERRNYVPATRGGYAALPHVQKGEGRRALLTEGPRQAKTRRRGDSGGNWRRGRPVLADGSTWRCSERLDPSVGLGEVLRRRRRGQCGLRCPGGRQLRGGGPPAAAARGPIPASARAWRREQGLGDRPCTGAELLRGPVGAGLQRSGVPAGEQGRRAAEQGGRGAWTSAVATG